MHDGRGNLRAELSSESQDKAREELISTINEVIRPPQAVSAESVHIRAMFVVSDQVNSFGGRFPVEEHGRLCELLVDSPVLVGHRKDQLPIARTFLARPVLRDGVTWVKSYFYWPKNGDGAGRLAELIDGGVIKECSIGFTFGFAECSICGSDIRTCRHQPLTEYATAERSTLCHFNYRQIEQVLETSLVYRGATAGTSITDELGLPGEFLAALAVPPTHDLNDPSDLQPDQPLIIVPRYAGVPVMAHLSAEGWLLRRVPSGTLRLELSSGSFDSNCECRGEFPGRLVAYRGKERCRLVDSVRFIETGSGPATRAVLYLFPTTAHDVDSVSFGTDLLAVRAMRFHGAFPRNLPDQCRQLATKDGVEIWLRGSDGSLLGRNYRPQAGKRPRPLAASDEPGAEVVSLRIDHPGIDGTFTTTGFTFAELSSGKRFLLDRTRNGAESAPAAVTLTPTRCQGKSNGWRMTLGGDDAGRYVMRPVRLNGRSRLLFYRESATTISTGK